MWLVAFISHNLLIYHKRWSYAKMYQYTFNCIQIKKKWPLGNTNFWLKEYVENKFVYLFKYWKLLTINHYSSWPFSLLNSTVNLSVPPKSVNFTMPISFEIHHNILSKCINFENRFFARHIYFRPSFSALTATLVYDFTIMKE